MAFGFGGLRDLNDGRFSVSVVFSLRDFKDGRFSFLNSFQRRSVLFLCETVLVTRSQ